MGGLSAITASRTPLFVGLLNAVQGSLDRGTTPQPRPSRRLIRTSPLIADRLPQQGY
jgi:hypothetical protein